MANLTQANKTALKAHILGNPVALPLVNLGLYRAVADIYNATATPDFWAFRSAIETGMIGKTVIYLAVSNMTTANLDRVNNFLLLNPITFTGSADVKALFVDVFGGTLGGQGQATRDALDLMLRRLSTLAEKVCATGTGSTASPATLTFDGPLNAADIENILVNG